MRKKYWDWLTLGLDVANRMAKAIQIAAGTANQRSLTILFGAEPYVPLKQIVDAISCPFKDGITEKWLI